MQSVEEVI